MNPKNKSLDHYLRLFCRLRTDRTGGWDASTCNQAPHKPFLLLSVLDLFSQGDIQTNFIQITPELGQIFATYWSKVMPIERRGNLALPFFHLRSSGFWQLVPIPGAEVAVKNAKQIDTLGRLKKIVLGARLEDELFHLMQYEENRNIIRASIIQTYFSPQYHTLLSDLGQVNIDAFRYGQQLVNLLEVKQRKSKIISNPTFVIKDSGEL
jgi:putative restriction endonuclease